MKIKYLGTAAAEGWPGLFCSCEHCKRARLAGGRNLRSRSQALIDEALLIDFPPDTYLHVLYQGLNLAHVTHCLITHDHSDHLYPADFALRFGVFAHMEETKCLIIHATRPAYQKIGPYLERQSETCEMRASAHLVTPFVPFKAESYDIVPLKAEHAPACEPVFYLISKDGRTLLYAHDTGYFPDETWHWLAEEAPHLDLISLDCTTLQIDCREGHMGLEACFDVKKRLLNEQLADEQSVFVINHFSHNGGLIHDELVPVAEKYGFVAAYDGLELEIL